MVVPLKNSTLFTVPPASVALAVIVTVEPVEKSALLFGPVNDTTGGVFPLLTVTVIGDDDAVAPLLSVAFAVSV